MNAPWTGAARRRAGGLGAVAVALLLLVACGPALQPAPTGAPDQRPSGSTTAVPGTPAAAASPAGATETARVVRVVDGDTIVVDRGRGNEKVRYIGMDTPESVKPNTPVEFMATEASAANAALVEGRTVTLERDVSETDRYGRLLRYVWVADPAGGAGLVMVNLLLVEQGYAQVSTWPPDVAHADLFVAAERAARDAGLGLWGAATASPASTLIISPGSITRPGTAAGACDPSYPDVCIPPAPPDLDCADIAFRAFRVLPPDPHRFDGNHDGIGCEG